MKMKRVSKLCLGVCLAIGLAIVFTACVSAPPAILGLTLEETLGKSLVELEEMLGTTQTEFENLLGRKLKNDEVDNDGYFVSSYPKTGLSTLFSVVNGRVSEISIGIFTGQNVLDTLVRQTDEKLGNSITVEIGNGITYFWSYKDDFAITFAPRKGSALWVMEVLN
jgi:hypothetical protein